MYVCVCVYACVRVCVRACMCVCFRANNLKLNISSGNAGSTDAITFYEIAVGTSRTNLALLENVKAFVNVGTNTKWTFTGLGLSKKSPKYYVTVRAHSQSGAVAQVSSNGVKVWPKTTVTSGIVEVAKYVEDILYDATGMTSHDTFSPSHELFQTR